MPEDLAAIQAIARAAFEPFVAAIGRAPAPMVADFAAQIAAGQVRVLVSGGVVGYIVCYAKGSDWHIENLAILPTTQGSGFGTLLLADAEDRGRAAGASRADLYTNAAMTGALAFYPRHGYRLVDRRMEDGFDRVYFAKPLDSPPHSA